MGISVSTILPSFNEELNLDRCIQEVTNALDSSPIDKWETIIVNDGSKDKTAEVAARLSSADPRIKVVTHPKNLGYGEALLSGIRAAENEWIFITDSDLQFFPDEIKNLIPLTAEANFIQGIRVKRADPLIRVVMGKVYKAVVRLMFSVPAKDPECSFRLVKASLLKDLKLESRGALVPLEIVLKASMQGAKFAEVPVRHRIREHGTSNAVTLKTFSKLLKEISLLYVFTRKMTASLALNRKRG